MNHVLEGSRLFAIVAWVLILSFSLFTYSLAQTLNHTVQTMEKNTPHTLDQLNAQQITQQKTH